MPHPWSSFAALLSLFLVADEHAQAQSRMGYVGSVSAYSLTECDNGDMILQGEAFTLLRVHADGTLVWAKTLDTPGTIAGVAETLSGDLLVAATAADPDLGVDMPALIRLSSAGELISASSLQFPDFPLRAARFMTTSIDRHVLLEKLDRGVQQRAAGSETG